LISKTRYNMIHNNNYFFIVWSTQNVQNPYRETCRISELSNQRRTFFLFCMYLFGYDSWVRCLYNNKLLYLTGAYKAPYRRRTHTFTRTRDNNNNNNNNNRNKCGDRWILYILYIFMFVGNNFDVPTLIKCGLLSERINIMSI